VVGHLTRNLVNQTGLLYFCQGLLHSWRLLYLAKEDPQMIAGYYSFRVGFRQNAATEYLCLVAGLHWGQQGLVHLPRYCHSGQGISNDILCRLQPVKESPRCGKLQSEVSPCFMIEEQV